MGIGRHKISSYSWSIGTSSDAGEYLPYDQTRSNWQLVLETYFGTVKLSSKVGEYYYYCEGEGGGQDSNPVPALSFRTLIWPHIMGSKSRTISFKFIET